MDRFTAKTMLAKGYRGLVFVPDGLVNGFFEGMVNDCVVGPKEEVHSVPGLNDGAIVVV